MPTIAETIQNAEQHRIDGHLRHAEYLYRLTLQKNPNNPVALYSMGLIAHQKGNNDTAAELIKKAILNKPDIPQYHNRCLYPNY